MNASLLTVSPSPHLLGSMTMRSMHVEIMLAMAPAALAGLYFFGVPALINLVAATLAAVVFEYLCVKLFKLPDRQGDLHAVVLGLTLGLILPPGGPIYLPIMGGLLAVGLAKMIFGGIGAYPMNPVLIAWAGLTISWPEQMKAFFLPCPGDGKWEIAETFLMKLRNDPEVITSTDLSALWAGLTPGEIGTTCTWAIIAGGIYLIVRGIINWRVPLGVFVGTLVMSQIAQDTDPSLIEMDLAGSLEGLRITWLHLGDGGLMFAAFFLATEPVSSPVTPKGTLLYGLGIGFLAVIIRTWGAAPGDGVYYAVLLMSTATPMFDRLRPAVLGKAQREW